MTDTNKISFPEASVRILSLIQKKKQLEKLIKAIESDSEYIQYHDELRAWFMQSDTKSFEMGKLKFSFVKYRPSKWWKMKPKEFIWKYPELAEKIGNELFMNKEANGRLTIKIKEDKNS